MKIKTICSSATSAKFYQTTRYYISHFQTFKTKKYTGRSIATLRKSPTCNVSTWIPLPVTSWIDQPLSAFSSRIILFSPDSQTKIAIVFTWITVATSRVYIITSSVLKMEASSLARPVAEVRQFDLKCPTAAAVRWSLFLALTPEAGVRACDGDFETVDKHGHTENCNRTGSFETKNYLF
jgi:hypothetical protein